MLEDTVAVKRIGEEVAGSKSSEILARGLNLLVMGRGTDTILVSSITGPGQDGPEVSTPLVGKGTAMGTKSLERCRPRGLGQTQYTSWSQIHIRNEGRCINPHRLTNSGHISLECVRFFLCLLPFL